MKRSKEIPPCAASMGCLCAGHARGNAASAACDTRETIDPSADAARVGIISERALLEWARTLEKSIQVLNRRPLAIIRNTADMSDAVRAIDAAIEGLVMLRARADGQTDKRRATLLRKVRRALGYTYP